MIKEQAEDTVYGQKIDVKSPMVQSAKKQDIMLLRTRHKLKLIVYSGIFPFMFLDFDFRKQG